MLSCLDVGLGCCWSDVSRGRIWFFILWCLEVWIGLVIMMCLWFGFDILKCLEVRLGFDSWRCLEFGLGFVSLRCLEVGLGIDISRCLKIICCLGCPDVWIPCVLFYGLFISILFIGVVMDIVLSFSCCCCCRRCRRRRRRRCRDWCCRRCVVVDVFIIRLRRVYYW